jgi:hypothetical protein
MTKLAVIVIIAGCVDAPELGDRSRPQIAAIAAQLQLHDPPCDQLPSVGLCAHLCDPDGLAPYIPAGTCVDLECTLTDGTVIHAGGCN